MDENGIIVVTGAHSTVGMEIVKQLTTSGRKVRAAVRDLEPIPKIDRHIA